MEPDKKIIGTILMIFGVIFTVGGIAGMFATPFLIIFGSGGAMIGLGISLIVGVAMIVGGWLLMKD